LEELGVWRDDLDRSSHFIFVSEFQDLLFDLKRLVIGELDNMRLWLEERLINIDLRVTVNAIVGDIEVLDDLGFWKLINNASARLLVFY
jgi:hypothetical protein